MPKNIAFFADGTWDEPSNNSNVVKLYSAASNIDGVQLTSYDPGVGTDGDPISDLLGGALGDGLFRKIKRGYIDIAAQYLPGDRIFIFGFSRGAYTARSLAGMIAVAGLPTVNQNDPQCLDMAFEAYRNVSQRQMLLDTLNETYQMDNAKIQLLGVWDTVGSLGIPAIFGGIDVVQYGFLDTGLHPDVLNAVQRCPSMNIDSSSNPLSGPLPRRPDNPSRRCGSPASIATWAVAHTLPIKVDARSPTSLCTGWQTTHRTAACSSTRAHFRPSPSLPTPWQPSITP